MKTIRYKTIIFFIIGIISVCLIIQFVTISISRAFYNRGHAYLKKGELDKATQEFRAAFHFNKKNYLAYEGLGIVDSNKNRFDEAINDYNAAIHFNPNYADAYYNRGIAFLNKEDFDKAMLDFGKAIQLNPGDFLSYEGRGIAYFKLKHADEAIHDYNDSIHLNSNYANAYYNRGRAYFTKGDFDKAISDYTMAIQLNSTDGNFYRDRGDSHYLKGDWGQAIDDYKNAIRIDPKDGLAYNDFAWLLATCPNLSVRNGSKAIELALQACEITEWKKWMSIDTLAAAYAEAGDFTQAIKYQTKTIDMEGIPETIRVDEQQRLNLYRQNKTFQEVPQQH